VPTSQLTHAAVGKRDPEDWKASAIVCLETMYVNIKIEHFSLGVSCDTFRRS